MPDSTVPISQTVSLKVSLHASTVAGVVLTDLSGRRHQLVDLTFGDDEVGVSLLGQLDDVRRLIIEADTLLARLSEEGRR